MLKGGVGRENRVVGFDDGRGNLFDDDKMEILCCTFKSGILLR
jgi:hypothetical protein